jgi:hypothetical protein
MSRYDAISFASRFLPQSLPNLLRVSNTANLNSRDLIFFVLKVLAHIDKSRSFIPLLAAPRKLSGHENEISDSVNTSTSLSKEVLDLHRRFSRQPHFGAD